MLQRLSSVLLVAAIVFVSLAEPLEDVCECECCYQTPTGQKECVRKSATSFQSQTCLACNVSTCVRLFPTQCGAKGATIQTECFERTAWYLRLIPVIFVVATAALLFYGLFIKTYDGYNPIPIPDDPESPSSVGVASRSAVYHTITQGNFDSHQPHAVRRPSPLSQATPLAGNFLSNTAGEMPISARRTSHASHSSLGMHVPRLSPLAAPSIIPLTANSIATVKVTEPLSPPAHSEAEMRPRLSGVHVVEIANPASKDAAEPDRVAEENPTKSESKRE